ncbi:MAG: carboxylating nicotinate-nucleotide diphosphorylase [Deltaproteobacteria bacterium]|nr:carboxylating nicotinate-nucleotide diphosphorylase [Deltaproteobacteria bacterium]
MDVRPQEIDPFPLLDMALEEDLGSAGDVTSLAVLDENARGEAVIRSKETGVLAGTFLLAPLFARLDPDLAVQVLLEDGARLEPGREICRLSGALAPILAGERTALNFLQRLSGVATRTARFVSLVSETRATVLDTRKTTPGLRALEKRAVLAGGGQNHRFGLHDMILIKDTHVAACGGPGNAVRKAVEFREARPDRAGLRIEVEVQSTSEFEEALSAGPDRIMLDNMPPGRMADCVRIRDARAPGIELEASGNITEATLRAAAESGVDFVSAGGLTHSVRALDIHLVIL